MGQINLKSLINATYCHRLEPAPDKTGSETELLRLQSRNKIDRVDPLTLEKRCESLKAYRMFTFFKDSDLADWQIATFDPLLHLAFNHSDCTPGIEIDKIKLIHFLIDLSQNTIRTYGNKKTYKVEKSTLTEEEGSVQLAVVGKDSLVGNPYTAYAQTWIDGIKNRNTDLQELVKTAYTEREKALQNESQGLQNFIGATIPLSPSSSSASLAEDNDPEYDDDFETGSESGSDDDQDDTKIADQNNDGRRNLFNTTSPFSNPDINQSVAPNESLISNVETPEKVPPYQNQKPVKNLVSGKSKEWKSPILHRRPSFEDKLDEFCRNPNVANYNNIDAPPNGQIEKFQTRVLEAIKEKAESGSLETLQELAHLVTEITTDTRWVYKPEECGELTNTLEKLIQKLKPNQEAAVNNARQFQITHAVQAVKTFLSADSNPRQLPTLDKDIKSEVITHLLKDLSDELHQFKIANFMPTPQDSTTKVNWTTKVNRLKEIDTSADTTQACEGLIALHTATQSIVRDKLIEQTSAQAAAEDNDKPFPIVTDTLENDSKFQCLVTDLKGIDAQIEKFKNIYALKADIKQYLNAHDLNGINTGNTLLERAHELDPDKCYVKQEDRDAVKDLANNYQTRGTILNSFCDSDVTLIQALGHYEQLKKVDGKVQNVAWPKADSQDQLTYPQMLDAVKGQILSRLEAALGLVTLDSLSQGANQLESINKAIEILGDVASEYLDNCNKRLVNAFVRANIVSTQSDESTDQPQCVGAPGLDQTVLENGKKLFDPLINVLKAHQGFLNKPVVDEEKSPKIGEILNGTVNSSQYGKLATNLENLFKNFKSLLNNAVNKSLATAVDNKITELNLQNNKRANALGQQISKITETLKNWADGVEVENLPNSASTEDLASWINTQTDKLKLEFSELTEVSVPETATRIANFNCTAKEALKSNSDQPITEILAINGWLNQENLPPHIKDIWKQRLRDKVTGCATALIQSKTLSEDLSTQLQGLSGDVKDTVVSTFENVLERTINDFVKNITSSEIEDLPELNSEALKSCIALLAVVKNDSELIVSFGVADRSLKQNQDILRQFHQNPAEKIVERLKNLKALEKEYDEIAIKNTPIGKLFKGLNNNITNRVQESTDQLNQAVQNLNAKIAAYLEKPNENIEYKNLQEQYKKIVSFAEKSGLEGPNNNILTQAETLNRALVAEDPKEKFLALTAYITNYYDTKPLPDAIKTNRQDALAEFATQAIKGCLDGTNQNAPTTLNQLLGLGDALQLSSDDNSTINTAVNIYVNGIRASLADLINGYDTIPPILKELVNAKKRLARISNLQFDAVRALMDDIEPSIQIYSKASPQSFFENPLDTADLSTLSKLRDDLDTISFKSVAFYACLNEKIEYLTLRAKRSVHTENISKGNINISQFGQIDQFLFGQDFINFQKDDSNQIDLDQKKLADLSAAVNAALGKGNEINFDDVANGIAEKSKEEFSDWIKTVFGDLANETHRQNALEFMQLVYTYRVISKRNATPNPMTAQDFCKPYNGAKFNKKFGVDTQLINQMKLNDLHNMVSQLGKTDNAFGGGTFRENQVAHREAQVLVCNGFPTKRVLPTGSGKSSTFKMIPGAKVLVEHAPLTQNTPGWLKFDDLKNYIRGGQLPQQNNLTYPQFAITVDDMWKLAADNDLLTQPEALARFKNLIWGLDEIDYAKYYRSENNQNNSVYNSIPSFLKQKGADKTLSMSATESINSLDDQIETHIKKIVETVQDTLDSNGAENLAQRASSYIKKLGNPKSQESLQTAIRQLGCDIECLNGILKRPQIDSANHGEFFGDKINEIAGEYGKVYKDGVKDAKSRDATQRLFGHLNKLQALLNGRIKTANSMARNLGDLSQEIKWLDSFKGDEPAKCTFNRVDSNNDNTHFHLNAVDQYVNGLRSEDVGMMVCPTLTALAKGGESCDTVQRTSFVRSLIEKCKRNSDLQFLIVNEGTYYLVDSNGLQYKVERELDGINTSGKKHVSIYLGRSNRGVNAGKFCNRIDFNDGVVNQNVMLVLNSLLTSKSDQSIVEMSQAVGRLRYGDKNKHDYTVYTDFKDLKTMIDTLNTNQLNQDRAQRAAALDVKKLSKAQQIIQKVCIELNNQKSDWMNSFSSYLENKENEDRLTKFILEYPSQSDIMGQLQTEYGQWQQTTFPDHKILERLIENNRGRQISNNCPFQQLGVPKAQNKDIQNLSNTLYSGNANLLNWLAIGGGSSINKDNLADHYIAYAKLKKIKDNTTRHPTYSEWAVCLLQHVGLKCGHDIDPTSGKDLLQKKLVKKGFDKAKIDQLDERLMTAGGANNNVSKAAVKQILDDSFVGALSSVIAETVAEKEKEKMQNSLDSAFKAVLPALMSQLRYNIEGVDKSMSQQRYNAGHVPVTLVSHDPPSRPTSARRPIVCIN